MEFGLKSLPSVFFLILGLVRYIEIRAMGVSAYKYSKHFQTKCVISTIMGVANIVYIVVCFALPASKL